MIKLHRISPNDIISDAPQFFNEIFSMLENHINALEGVLDNDTKVINLTDSNVPTPAGSLVANNIVLLGKSDVVFSISNSVNELLSLSSTGALKCQQIIAKGDVNSEIDNLDTKTITVEKSLTVNETITLSSIVKKAKRVILENSNMGELATTPIQIADAHLILLDYHSLSEARNQVNLDTTTVAENQTFRLQLLSNPASGKAEILKEDLFAVIDPTTASGFRSLTVDPEFAYENVIGKRESYLDVQWMNIGNGTFKLVILDSKNVIYENIVCHNFLYIRPSGDITLSDGQTVNKEISKKLL